VGRAERRRTRHRLDPVVDDDHGLTVSAVGSGALPIQGAIPIIIGANVGTTVTTSLVALTFIGNRAEFRRALGASTVHDFYNWLALLIFFPIELIWHPLQRISRALTDALYGTGWLPNPAHFNIIRAATRPVEHAVIQATSHLGSTLGPVFHHRDRRGADPARRPPPGEAAQGAHGRPGS
jgi:solute carrier family 34 (sodium-dependent phosphate cotransporter)